MANIGMVGFTSLYGVWPVATPTSGTGKVTAIEAGD